MKNIDPPNTTRRDFLRTAGAAAAAAPFLLPSGLRAEAPNSNLCHACIGVTRMGLGDLKTLKAQDPVQIVALCDVDTEHLEEAARIVPDARLYTDWRELFEEEGDRIDSVNITTPDHMHFPIAMAAVERGKHIYCQKPMCHDIAEVRALTEAAVGKGIVTQLGTQHTSQIGDRMTVQLLQDGAIGKVQRVYLCSNRAAPNRVKGPRPAAGVEPPSHLKWDLWIGTAPMRPFAPEIYHPATWRGWLDFGTSWVADMGPHILDAVWRGLDLKAPKSVTARVEASWRNSPERMADNWPQSEHVRWTFPRGKGIAGKELTVEWFDGEFTPPEEAHQLYLDYCGKEYPQQAALLIGTKGALLKPLSGGPLLMPRKKFKGYSLPRFPGKNHYQVFVDACMGGEKSNAHFAQTGPMMEALLLGTVAIRCFDKELHWDSKAMKIPNNPDAERYLKREYRDGW